MEARSKLLDGTTASRRWTRKLVLLLPPLLLFLLRTESLQGLESDERFRTRENECHFYAGGQVYPGEASRVSVADHSLHLSKAKISKPAPYWEGTAVINGEFKELKLTDYRGKYLVFFFYPLDFTFVCPTEIIAFGDRIEEFKSINTEVVACSVDSQFTHLAWINTPRRQGGLGPIRIPLLSDLNHQISKDYGVYLEDSGHTLRGLFIIDDKGVLRQITLNDLPVGRSVDETLRLVQAFQYTDKHGEVCPAGWKPGSETIIPDPAGKLKKELGGFTEDAMVPLGLYTGQLALNWAWPPIFFGARQMGWALADLLLVSGVATATTLAWHRVSPPAARLLYPYLAWLAFATVLNYYVWRDNSGRRGGSRLPE